MAENKDLNRLKVVLAEKKKSKNMPKPHRKYRLSLMEIMVNHYLKKGSPFWAIRLSIPETKSAPPQSRSAPYYIK